jgi:hypothetical protein
MATIGSASMGWVQKTNGGEMESAILLMELSSGCCFIAVNISTGETYIPENVWNYGLCPREGCFVVPTPSLTRDSI